MMRLQYLRVVAVVALVFSMMLFVALPAAEAGMIRVVQRKSDAKVIVFVTDRRSDADRGGIDGLRGFGAQCLVDGVRHALRGGEVRGIQIKNQVSTLIERAGDDAFHRGAVRHPAHQRIIDGYFRTVLAAGTKAAHH